MNCESRGFGYGHFYCGGRIFTAQCMLRKSKAAVHYGFPPQGESCGSDRFYFFKCTVLDLISLQLSLYHVS